MGEDSPATFLFSRVGLADHWDLASESSLVSQRDGRKLPIA